MTFGIYMDKSQKTDKVQNYRIELRYDFTGTEEEARENAQEAATTISSRSAFGHAEITAIFDENWEEI